MINTDNIQADGWDMDCPDQGLTKSYRGVLLELMYLTMPTDRALISFTHPRTTHTLRIWVESLEEIYPLIDGILDNESED